MRWKTVIGIIAITLTFFNLPLVAQSVKLEKTDTSQGKSILQSLEAQLTSVVKRIEPAVVGVKNAQGQVATGVLYRSDGYLLTTALVDSNSAVDMNVSRAQTLVNILRRTKVDKSKFTVQLADGATYDAQLVKSDVSTGISVLKINADNFPTVEFGDSDALEKGAWVMVIGNSYGMSNSISTGIVSGLNRQVNGREMFQITAPINPGMSGAPVINSDGRVVGLVASTFRRAVSTWKEELMLKAARSLEGPDADVWMQYLENIPEEAAKYYAKSAYPSEGVMTSGGHHSRITTVHHLQHANASELASKLTNLLQKHKGMAKGVVTVNIVPDEKTNSLIVQIEGSHADINIVGRLIQMLDKPQPASQAELEAMLTAIKAENDAKSAAKKVEEVRKKVERVQKNLGGALEGVIDKLNQMPVALSSEGMNFAIPINDAKYAAEQLIQYGKVNYGWLGVDVKAVPPALQAQLGLEAGHGVLIKGITQKSPAEKAGLKQWDIVLRFSDTKVDTPKALQRLARRTTPGQKVSINVIRKGKPLTLALEIGTALK